jgi:hypothetical protein
MRKNLDLAQLEVVSFPVAPDDAQFTSFTGSTDYCCDTNRDCSSACRRPTNICVVCG